MDNLIAWFSLKAIPGIGNHLYKRLIDEFGAPQQVLQTPRDRLLTVTGITEKIAAAITGHQTPATVYKNIELCRRRRIDVITMTDNTYPVLLREIPDPPPYLYVMGKLIPDAACLAVVGSRQPTRYGLSMAEQLSRDIALRGITIVSGLARGIDTAAHQGALNVGGATCAVLGSGLGNFYPRENKRLAERIAESGAVISEFPVLAEPAAHHFPARNRIISGMSLGTVVVEAARKSGSLITARLAAEQGREVFAVPGSIQSFKSVGAHGLLKQGAKLVETAADVFEEIPHMLSHEHTLPVSGRPTTKKRSNDSHISRPSSDLSEDETLILGILEAYPLHIDDIVRDTSLTPGKTATALLNLELKGLIQQEPGKRFYLKEVNFE